MRVAISGFEPGFEKGLTRGLRLNRGPPKPSKHSTCGSHVVGLVSLPRPLMLSWITTRVMRTRLGLPVKQFTAVEKHSLGRTLRVTCTCCVMKASNRQEKTALDCANSKLPKVYLSFPRLDLETSRTLARAASQFLLLRSGSSTCLSLHQHRPPRASRASSGRGRSAPSHRLRRAAFRNPRCSVSHTCACCP